MFETLADISLDILPQLLSGEGPLEVLQDELDKYLGKLKENKENLIQTHVGLVATEGEINLTEFKKLIGDTSGTLFKLVSSTGIRILCSP